MATFAFAFAFAFAWSRRRRRFVCLTASSNALFFVGLLIFGFGLVVSFGRLRPFTMYSVRRDLPAHTYRVGRELFVWVVLVVL